MQVTLTERKALTVEGHISMQFRAGETVNLPDEQAQDAIARGWAVAWYEPVAPQEKAIATPKEKKAE